MCKTNRNEKRDFSKLWFSRNSEIIIMGEKNKCLSLKLLLNIRYYLTKHNLNTMYILLSKWN